MTRECVAEFRKVVNESTELRRSEPAMTGGSRFFRRNRGEWKRSAMVCPAGSNRVLADAAR